jgi:molybdopterin/thiamine biosynthesis adenylyltransferase
LPDEPRQRYHRQTLLPQIGEAGQRRLAASRVLLVGCGALGTTIADQLVRAGVGHLAVVDRDIVELTNLQRQTLFDESDAAAETPKAIAAARRLRAINSVVEVVPVVADVHAGNIEEFLKPGVDLILDGTDNVQTRYLVNDVSVKHGVPWVYGAAVGVEGRVMSVSSPTTPCLRCVFPTPPTPADLPTCDTAGVLGMSAMIVAGYQVIEALRILTGAGASQSLLRLDFWPPRSRVVSTADARRDDCECCGRRRFEYLEAATGDGTVSLCGRNAVQVRPIRGENLDLSRTAERLSSVGEVERTPYFVRCHLRDPAGVKLTVFPDGRSLIHGVRDLGRAQSIYARFIGS